MLDIPTFITVFQELLAHSDISVRQKAFEMLTSRLEALDMSTKSSFVEVCLLTYFSFNICTIISKLLISAYFSCIDGIIHRLG